MEREVSLQAQPARRRPEYDLRDCWGRFSSCFLFSSNENSVRRLLLLVRVCTVVGSGLHHPWKGALECPLIRTESREGGERALTERRRVASCPCTATSEETSTTTQLQQIYQRFSGVEIEISL
jgi:hypothetical protein